MSRLALEFRKQVEINTDLQRRCYNGCNAKSELLWTDWTFLYFVSSEEEGNEAIKTFSKINPHREYRLI